MQYTSQASVPPAHGSCTEQHAGLGKETSETPIHLVAWSDVDDLYDLRLAIDGTDNPPSTDPGAT
jgi:hypothetical protein